MYVMSAGYADTFYNVHLYKSEVVYHAIDHI